MRTSWLLSAALLVGGPALAQPANCPANCPMNCPHPGMRGGGWSSGPYARLYDAKTVETIRGEVTSLEHVAPMRGMSEGVHAVVKTDQGPVTVALGPAWYLDNQDPQLAVGDRIEVRGSRVAVDGKPTLIAAEVKKGAETLKLRDDSGRPVWRGWR